MDNIKLYPKVLSACLHAIKIYPKALEEGMDTMKMYFTVL